MVTRVHSLVLLLLFLFSHNLFGTNGVTSLGFSLFLYTHLSYWLSEFQDAYMHTDFLTFVSCLIPHAHYRDITWFNLEQFLCIAVWCGDFYSSEAITIDVLVKMFNFRTVKKYFNFLNLFTSLLLKAVKGVTFSLNNSAVIMTIILNPWQFWPYLPARYHLCYFESLN